MSSEENNQAELQSFETDLRELDEVVTALEAGRVSLEESLQLLRRGMALAERCDQTLAQAEATLEQLVATSTGELVAQRIGWDDDEEDEDSEEEDTAEED